MVAEQRGAKRVCLRHSADGKRGIERLREVALLVGGRGNGVQAVGGQRFLNVLLIADEEERPVAAVVQLGESNGTAKGTAEIVAA